MNSDFERVFPGDGITAEQRHALDQQQAWVTENISGMVAAAARHYSEDGCREPDQCPGSQVSQYIHQLDPNSKSALLIGAICDLAGFFTVVREGSFTPERLAECFLAETGLYEQLMEDRDDQL